jgi:hypothetical protein
MLSFASHQLSERQVWALGRLASRVVSLTWPNVGIRFEVSTLSVAPFLPMPNVQGL